MQFVTTEEHDKILDKCKDHLRHLKLITDTTNRLPGKCCWYLSDGITPNTDPRGRQNILTLARQAKIIIEIGFNAGHSALLMLTVNPHCIVYSYDNCANPYTKHCYRYLANKFPQRLFLIQGDSAQTLGSHFEKFGQKADFLLIDGSKDFLAANLDFFNGKQNTHKGGFILFNDTHLIQLDNLWKGYLRDNFVREIEIFPIAEQKIGSVR
jgi:hypothetical protein